MKSGDEHKRFEKRLESERPQPSDEFLSDMTDRLASKQPYRARGWRVALAGGLTALLVLAFALTGGIGYAASAVKGGSTAVTTLVTGSSKSEKTDKSATQSSNNASSTSANQSTSSAASASSAAKNNGQKGNDTSAARKQYQDKVVICHRPAGNPENAHTISVSPNAVPAHLAHGDTLGPCPNGR